MEASAAVTTTGVLSLRKGPSVRRRSECFLPATVRFADEGHSRYYASARCGGKEEKRREKMMKGLRRDLVELKLGFGDEMVGEAKGKMVSEAADLLLAQLTKLQTDDKEMKRKMKLEKAALKAAKKNDCKEDMSSGSSSSESSDCDCETETKTVLEASSIVTAPFQKLLKTESEDKLEDENIVLRLQTDAKEMKRKKKQEKAAMKAAKKKDCKEDKSSSSSSSESSDSDCETKTKTVFRASSILTAPFPKLLTTVSEDKLEDKNIILRQPEIKNIEADNKIEVCMGGKCKKSGAVELLAELDRKVGIEGAVTGCKCMGKCKEGPNVRLVNSVKEDEVVKVAMAPLCIGVGLEDVSSIVENFFGDGKDVGFAAA